MLKVVSFKRLNCTDDFHLVVLLFLRMHVLNKLSSTVQMIYYV
jgi:hypothetical protein